MSQELVQQLANLPPIPAAAARSQYAGQRLGEGIEAPFAILGYKGGKWSIRHRGVTQMLFQYDENQKPVGPKPFIDVVIVARAPTNSKVYYEKTYGEGDDAPPDCWSNNGATPDPAVEKPQSPSCLNCKWNQFGSRVNQATGSKGKACADIRRLAVVPEGDIKNAALGGPMLLRVPPASLSSLGHFSDGLDAAKYPFNALVTRIGFDPTKAYPLMTFQVKRGVSEQEMEEILEQEKNPSTARILNLSEEHAAAAPAPAPAVTQPVTPPAAPQPAPHAAQQALAAPSPAMQMASVTVLGGVPANDPLAFPAGLDRRAQATPASAAPAAPPVAVATPAAVVVPPCPPGVDPAQWAAFQAMQQAQAAPAAPAGEAPKPRQRRARTAPPSPAPTDASIPAQAPQAAAAPASSLGLPGTPIVPDGDDPQDDAASDAAVASISSRLAGML